MIIINFTTETGKLGLGTNDDQLCYSLTVRFSSCLAGHEHGQLCHMMIDVNDVVWFAGKTVWYTWAPSVRAYIHLPLPFTLHTANGCVAISFAIAASDRKNDLGTKTALFGRNFNEPIAIAMTLATHVGIVKSHRSIVSDLTNISWKFSSQLVK